MIHYMIYLIKILNNLEIEDIQELHLEIQIIFINQLIKNLDVLY